MNNALDRVSGPPSKFDMALSMSIHDRGNGQLHAMSVRVKGRRRNAQMNPAFDLISDRRGCSWHSEAFVADRALLPAG